MSLSEADGPRNDNASATAAFWDCSQNPKPAGLEAPENEQVEPVVDAILEEIGTSQPGIDCQKPEGGSSPSRHTPLADRAEFLNQCYQPQQPPAPQRSAVQRTAGLAELAVQLMQRQLAVPSKARSLTRGARINTGALENAFETENISPGKAAEESSQRRSALMKAGVSATEPQAVSQRQPHSSSPATPPISGNQLLLGLSACAAIGLVSPLLSNGQISSASATPSLAHAKCEDESEPGAMLVPVSLAASPSPWRRRRLGSFANHGASRSNAAMDAPVQRSTLPAACQLPTVCQTSLHRAHSKRSPAFNSRAAESVSRTLNEDPQHSQLQVTDGGASGAVGAAGGAPEQLAAADTPGEGTY